MRSNQRSSPSEQFPARGLWRLLLVLGLALLPALALFASPAGVSAANARFTVASTVSAQDESFVREGISLAQAYIASEYGWTGGFTISVDIRDTSDPDSPGTVAYAQYQDLVVFTGSDAWPTLPPFEKIQVMVHEFTHIYQRDKVGFYDSQMPTWFIEGMAEFVSFQAVAQNGLVPDGAVYDNNALSVLALVRALPSLQTRITTHSTNPISRSIPCRISPCAGWRATTVPSGSASS